MSVGAGGGRGSMLEHGEQVSGYTTEERAFSSPQQSSIANSSPIRRGAPKCPLPSMLDYFFVVWTYFPQGTWYCLKYSYFSSLSDFFFFFWLVRSENYPGIDAEVLLFGVTPGLVWMIYPLVLTGCDFIICFLDIITVKVSVQRWLMALLIYEWRVLRSWVAFNCCLTFKAFSSKCPNTYA